MTADVHMPASRPSTPAGLPGWLCALFFFSGVSGLVYEVVWVRLLTRILGHTVYATATVLAAFMAGLALGSLLAGRVADRCRRPLAWYALLELGIGFAALLSLWLPGQLLPVYRTLYEWASSSRAWLVAGQVGISLFVLLLPTTLMGATLPLLCAFGVRQRTSFGRCVGTLYALNTFGAATGVLASGFVLIGAVGETNTVLVGVVLNVVVAAVAAGFQPADGWESASWKLAATPPDPRGTGAVSCYPLRTRQVVLACFAASGFAALANEVVWGRLLQLYQGSSIYAFSAMLAVVLAGMALGGLVSARWVDRWPDPLRVLALLQLAIGLAGLAALRLFEWGALPKPDLASGRNLALLILAPLAFVGPLGLLWGIIVPVAARCCTPERGGAGRSIGALAAWNTAGCIVGALAAGFGLIPLFGASLSATALAMLSCLLGLWLLGAHPHGFRGAVGVAHASLLAGCALLFAFSGDSYNRVLRRRMGQFYPAGFELYRHREEAAGTTTAFGAVGSDPRARQLWVNGEGMTALVDEAKLMAHLPLWLCDDPRDVLVVCFGMGTTVRSASRHAGLEVWAVELLPAVLESFGYYHADGPELLRRPGVHAVVDDGRNFLLMNARTYDVITVDPAPPLASAGAVNLYSREFFQLCRARLRPRGVVCLWVPPANESEVKMIVRAFLDVFERVTVWEGPSRRRHERGFYLIGSSVPIRGIAARVRRGFHQAAVVADLIEWGKACDRPEKILDLYVADERPLRAFVADAAIITDDRPATEFPLWRALFGWRDYYRKLNGPRLRAYLKEYPASGATP